MRNYITAQISETHQLMFAMMSDEGLVTAMQVGEVS
jgi:hypothetical protein